MQTQCISEQLRFEGFDGRRVEAAFDGGAVTSDAGALLLRETDRAISLIDRVAGCFWDGRDPGRVVHTLRTLVGQRVIGLALGYEDVSDHDDLRFDPVLALVVCVKFSNLVMNADGVAPVGNASALSTGVSQAALRCASFLVSRR